MINLQNVKAKSGSIWHTICPFPVGFIYMSYTNTSPASTFGGQWTAIRGRFLYANASNGTGGSNTMSFEPRGHIRLGDFMKNSAEEVKSLGLTPSYPSFTDRVLVAYTAGESISKQTPSVYMNAISVSTMSQYQSCYCWRRTS